MKSVAALALAAMCSCSMAGKAEKIAIFEQPRSYLGTSVKVCGYIHFANEDTNIWPNKKAQQSRENGLGLLYIGRDAFQFNERFACASGEMIWVGCKTDKQKICNWSEYDYAIRVRNWLPE